MVPNFGKGYKDDKIQETSKVTIWDENTVCRLSKQILLTLYGMLEKNIGENLVEVCRKYKDAKVNATVNRYHCAWRKAVDLETIDGITQLHI